MHSASLTMVEVLLHEFYQPTTSNARKREIEHNLVAFKSQPEAWQLCLRVATANNSFAENQFVWFFSTSTLEHTIIRRWTQLSSNDRTMLRETLWNTYAHLGGSVSVTGSGNGDVAAYTTNANVPSRRHRDTLAQLIAIMGKREFPNEHPNYINHCIELIKTRFQLGINLLRVTSEEVVSTREDLTSDRKQYFFNCISMCIPDVMDLVTKYLLIAVCHINGKDIQTIPNTLMDYSLTATLPNDNQLSSSVVELLTCLQHLVSWIRTELISEYFLMSILDLSQLRQTHEEISLAALSVLNELLYLQKSLPYAATLMTGISGLLEQHNTCSRQHEVYSDKFRELLRLYTNKYATKMLQEHELLETFLKSLYCCTIQKNGALDFTEKLEIWTPIIKGLAQNPKMNHNDIVYQLVAEIIRRTQFDLNKAELELLENELVEDNPLTEWQQFLDQCFECIALVAETSSSAVFTMVFNHWSRHYVYLLCIGDAIDSGRSYDVAVKLKCQTFGEHLRDFATVCQAVVRVAPLLGANSPEVGTEVERQLQVLTENLLTTLKFLASNKLSTINVDKTTFQTDLDNLTAQILMAIRSIFSISKALSSEDLLHRLFETLGGLFAANDISSNGYGSGVGIGVGVGAISNIVHLAASELLLFISSVIRPKCLMDIPQLVNLLHAGPRLSHLSHQVVINIYISLVSYMVLPWKHVVEQQQNYIYRSAVLREYVECIAKNFLELDINVADESKVASTTLNLLSTFATVIEFFKASCNNAKEMLANTFKPIITKALTIFNKFGLGSISLATTVADFSLSILCTLPTQLGMPFVKEMVTLFIGICNREQLTLSRFAVLERILQMFQLIVEQPGNAALSLVSAILDFTTTHLLPLIQQTPLQQSQSQHHDTAISVDNSEITNLVYTLFDSILTCKWQFFYKNQISATTNSSSDNLHPAQFMTILNAYGQMLVTGVDPTNVRSVLQSMQNVNDRWRLYQRALFKEHLLASFQRALINLLMNGEGAMHFELIANALYAMGQADKQQLHDSFANAGLPVNQKLIDDICLTTDIPTFTLKLTQLMQDAHCAHLSES